MTTTTTHQIVCGNCKQTHPTPQQVKACYGGSGQLPQAELPFADSFPAAVTLSNTDGPTEKQLRFIAKLYGERPSLDQIVPATKRGASELIDSILRTPKEKASTVGANIDDLLGDVSDGYYALPCKTDTNDLDFIKVATGKDSGKRYIKRVLGGQGNIAISYAEQRAFAKNLYDLHQHAGDEPLMNARILFGMELGRCGCCGRTLTDETSRARGIGPTCWGVVA